MSYPNKHIDDLQTRLHQARLVQQRNNKASSFSFPRFVASLRGALKGIRKHEKQDPRGLVCDFADAIPGFNEILSKIGPEYVCHLGSDLFEVKLSGPHAGIPLLDPMCQVMSIDGKVLLDNYVSIDRACTGEDEMYFCLRRTDNVDAVELIGYDRQSACFRTLIPADRGYNDFLVLPGYNAIVAYTSPQSDVEFRLDSLEPVDESTEEEIADEKTIQARKTARRNRYYANMFGITGKHVLEKNNNGKYALFGIDPVSKKRRRITGRHSKILHSIRGGTQHIYAIDKHEDDARDIMIYSLGGDLLYKKHYASSVGFDALSALKSLPLGLHAELYDTETAQETDGKMVMCDPRGRKVSGLTFNHITKSGLGTTQCIWMPRKEGEIQFGLYSLEKQYRIIPPTMLSKIQFVSGVAVLHSPDGMKVVLAKDILECETKGVQYK